MRKVMISCVMRPMMCYAECHACGPHLRNMQCCAMHVAGFFLQQCNIYAQPDPDVSMGSPVKHFQFVMSSSSPPSLLLLMVPHPL